MQLASQFIISTRCMWSMYRDKSACSLHLSLISTLLSTFTIRTLAILLHRRPASTTIKSIVLISEQTPKYAAHTVSYTSHLIYSNQFVEGTWFIINYKNLGCYNHHYGINKSNTISSNARKRIVHFIFFSSITA